MVFLKTILFSWILLFCFEPASAQGEYGNRFVATQRLSVTLDQSGKKISYRFTCQDGLNLTAAAVYCAQAVNPPAYRVSLQDDAAGVPAGILLSSSSFVPLPQSWSTVPLPSIPLSKGKIYHLVLEPDRMRGGEHPVGFIGTSHCASFLTTDLLNHLHPNDGSPDPQANTLAGDGDRWKELNQEPVYAIYGDGANLQGNPYDNPGVRPIYGSGDPKDKAHQVWQGQSLHFHCGFTADSLVIRVRKQGNPKTPLNYFILKHNFHIHQTIPIYTAKAMSPDQAPAQFQWVTIGFGDKGKSNFSPECWFLVLQTDSGRPSSGQPGCDDCYLLSEVGNSGGLADAANLTFDGGPHLSRLVYSTDGGEASHWIDEFESDANLCALGPTCPPELHRDFEPIATPLPLIENFLNLTRP